MQPRDLPTTAAWRFDENLHAMGRQSTAPNGQNEPLLVYECRWSADLGSGCQSKPFGDSFWPPDIGRGVQPDVLGSLWSTGDATVSGGGGTECGTSDNGDPVSSVLSPGSPYTTVQPNDGNRVLSVMVWGAIHHGTEEWVGRGGWSNELASVHPDPEESNIAMAMGVFGRNFVYVQDNAPPHTGRDTAAFLDQQDVEVMDWPARGPDMNPIEHVWDQMSVWIRDMDDPNSTVAELNNAVRQAWAAVRPGRVWTLVESMPRRVKSPLAACSTNM